MSPQKYIDHLRDDNILKAIEFVDHVSLKYQNILNRKITEYELVVSLIYEFCQTNLCHFDLEKLQQSLIRLKNVYFFNRDKKNELSLFNACAKSAISLKFTPEKQRILDNIMKSREYMIGNETDGRATS